MSVFISVVHSENSYSSFKIPFKQHNCIIASARLNHFPEQRSLSYLKHFYALHITLIPQLPMGYTFLKLFPYVSYSTIRSSAFIFMISVSSKEFAKWYVLNYCYYHCIENDDESSC